MSGVLCVAAAALCLRAGQTAGGPVSIDRQNKRAEVVVSVPGGQVVVTLDPVTSLIVHATNLYDLNRQTGARSYSVRTDENARKAVDPDIYKAIAGKDRYFGGGALDLYEPTMQVVIARGLYRRPFDEKLLAEAAPEPFGRALAASWLAFYRDYWDRHFERLAAEFRAMSENVRWAEALARMQKLTGRDWRGSMFVVAAEGAGQSGFTAGGNVCVGGLSGESDAGFVHEGLHLLLRREWAKTPRIQRFMERRAFDDPFWGRRWDAKFEQAVVASLDILIRELNRKAPEARVVKSYLEGVRAGDIADIVWPLVKAYAEKPAGTFEDLMLAIITTVEARKPGTARE